MARIWRSPRDLGTGSGGRHRRGFFFQFEPRGTKTAVRRIGPFRRKSLSYLRLRRSDRTPPGRSSRLLPAPRLPGRRRQPAVAVRKLLSSRDFGGPWSLDRPPSIGSIRALVFSTQAVLQRHLRVFLFTFSRFRLSRNNNSPSRPPSFVVTAFMRSSPAAALHHHGANNYTNIQYYTAPPLTNQHAIVYHPPQPPQPHPRSPEPAASHICGLGRPALGSLIGGSRRKYMFNRHLRHKPRFRRNLRSCSRFPYVGCFRCKLVVRAANRGEFEVI